MDYLLFKFLLKKGLTLPRNQKELDFVKDNVFTDDELETPSYEETWKFVSQEKKEVKVFKKDQLKSADNYKGMARAARFGGKINDEVRKQMNDDKNETKKNLNKDDQFEERGTDN